MAEWPERHPEHLKRAPSFQHIQLLHTLLLSLKNDPSPENFITSTGILMAAFDPSVEIEVVDVKDDVKQRLGWPQADLDRIKTAEAAVFHHQGYVLSMDVTFVVNGRETAPMNSPIIRAVMFDALVAKGWDMSDAILAAELTNIPEEQKRINATRQRVAVADEVVAKFRAEMDATFQTWEGGEHGTHRGGTGDGSASA